MNPQTIEQINERLRALAVYVQEIEAIRDPAMQAFDYDAFKRLKSARLAAELRETGAVESAEYHVAREIFYAGVRAGRGE